MMAAAFRSAGVDATITPDSNADTLEIGGLHSGGEECLPHKITLGDFLRICRQPGFEPAKAAFFMPRAPGPCRFGQYATYLRQVLGAEGYGDALVFSPSSSDGYDGIGEGAAGLMHAAWMGVVVSDLATRLLLKTRPYETAVGAADAAFESALREFETALSRPGRAASEQLRELVDVVTRVRDRFRSVPAEYVKGRPLIGLVGEIYCRHNTFSNEDIARRVEQLGGECWLADISEWIWYTNWCRETDCLREDGWFNTKFLKLKLKSHYQHQYEQKLLAPVKDDFVGYEEPHDFREVVKRAEPYLPMTGSHGEMSVSVGKAAYLHGKGADGVIDISPFTCMNGIVSEAVYPAVSSDYDELPIRVLFFDKVATHIDRDLEIFLDLARAYQRRKKIARRYPAFFMEASG